MLSGQIKVVADRKDKKKHHRDKKHKKEVSITQHSHTIKIDQFHVTNSPTSFLPIYRKKAAK
jgi:hypothetical protein